jgi:hypothetical protein
MIENPFDRDPFEPSQAFAWGQGFLFGLTGPLESVDQAPDSITDDVRDAFNEGVLSGQDAAIHGLDIFPACIDTEEHEHVPPEAELAIDVAGFVVEVVKDAATPASAAFSMVFMTLVNIALAAHHFTPASEVIDGLSQDFFGTIEALGRQDCDFFLGGAVDFDAKGCQLQLTPLFRTQSDARDAAVALGRPTFFVSQWRANQCGAMTVVDGTTE